MPYARPTEPKRKRWEPPVDPRSWLGSLILIALFAAVLWAVQIANAADDYAYGLRPRSERGLWGVLTQPFLHASYGHLASNTLPLVLIGWVVMLAGPRLWALVSLIVVVVGGLLTWLVAPSDQVIVGASGLVFGWLGYLIARAIFSRSIKWIFSAIAVLVIFGTLLAGLIPSLHSDVSWQSHVCGFVAGVAAGAVLHQRGTELRRFRRPRTTA
jgi:membrane associated rhomboid family serine protease